MKLRDHFSEKDIKRLDELLKRQKIIKWHSTFGAIIMPLFICLFFWFSFFLAQYTGISPLRFFVEENIVCTKTYTHEEVNLIVLADLHFYSGCFFIFLWILHIFDILTTWDKKMLIKCWNLLSSEDDNIETG